MANLTSFHCQLILILLINVFIWGFPLVGSVYNLFPQRSVCILTDQHFPIKPETRWIYLYIFVCPQKKTATLPNLQTKTITYTVFSYKSTDT